MIGTDIKNEVLENFALSDTTEYDTQILRQINRALDLISTEPVVSIVEQEISLTTATRKYALPNGVVRVDGCYIDGHPQGLTRIAPEEIYRYAETTITGIPRFFWEDNQNIYVHPMPDHAYTLFATCKGRIPQLTALTDTLYLVGTTELAPAYCAAIPYFVTWRLAIVEKGDYAQLAADCKENWAALFKRAVDHDKSRIARRFGGRIPRRQGVRRPGFYPPVAE